MRVIVVVMVRKESFVKISQKALVILVLNFDQLSPLTKKHLSYMYNIQKEQMAMIKTWLMLSCSY